MKLKLAIQPIVGIVAVVILSGCAEQTRSSMKIDPLADETLRKMCSTIAGARSYSFRAETAMDEPIATGQMARFSRENRVVVHRPNRLMAEGRQGSDAIFLWYENQDLTVLDKSVNVYATLAVPGRIDEMLDDVAANHGLTLPMADLLCTDPYRVLTENVLTGRYLGTQIVEGTKCHHLLFTQDSLDWQIWISAADEPVPLKIVIDYKGMPDRPQFTARITDWNLSVQAKDEWFRPVVPKNAEKVDITQLLAAG